MEGDDSNLKEMNGFPFFEIFDNQGNQIFTFLELISNWVLGF